MSVCTIIATIVTTSTNLNTSFKNESLRYNSSRIIIASTK